jgi:hypothetical protein
MMSMGSTRVVVALTLALVLALCDASDRSRLFHNQIDADPPSVDVSDRLLSLLQTLEVDSPELFDNSCPVCDTDKLDVLDRFVKSTLFKYKRLIRNSSSFTRFRRALRRPLIRRHYNKRVSAETITPILQDTASHFSALADTARVTQNSIPDSDSLTDVYSILAEVATSSALFVTEVSNVLQNNDATTAGIVATSVLSILGFFERFTLATISTVTYFATTEVVVPESVQGNVDIFSVDALDDVFSDVMTFLSARGDTSGLISAIGSATANISNLKDHLLQLHSQADAVSQSKSTADAGSDATMQFEAYAEVVSLMDGMSFTVLSSAIGLAAAIPPIIGGIATGTVGLFQQRIQAIVSLVDSTSSSSREMLEEKAISSAVSGDTLYYQWCIKKNPLEMNDDEPIPNLQISPCAYPLLIVTSPIWLPALLIFLLLYWFNGRRNTFWSQVQCPMDSLSCQNDALAASLPSL